MLIAKVLIQFLLTLHFFWNTRLKSPISCHYSKNSYSTNKLPRKHWELEQVNTAAASTTISAAALRWQHKAMASSLRDPLLIFKVVWYHLIGKKIRKLSPIFFNARKVPILLRINATVDFLSTAPTRNSCHRTQKKPSCVVARVSTSPYIANNAPEGGEN